MSVPLDKPGQQQSAPPLHGIATLDPEPRWFVARAKQKLGPFTLAELRDQAVQGQLSATDMLLPEGSVTWIQAGSIGELFADLGKTLGEAGASATV